MGAMTIRFLAPGTSNRNGLKESLNIQLRILHGVVFTSSSDGSRRDLLKYNLDSTILRLMLRRVIGPQQIEFPVSRGGQHLRVHAHWRRGIS